jgi:hypothetical protein
MREEIPRRKQMRKGTKITQILTEGVIYGMVEYLYYE